MRPQGSPAELARRRMRAVELVEPGASRDVVARILGIHPGSISRWRRRARHEGGLQARPIPGRPPRLSDAQITELEQLLLKGAVASGGSTISGPARGSQP